MTEVRRFGALSAAFLCLMAVPVLSADEPWVMRHPYSVPNPEGPPAVVPDPEPSQPLSPGVCEPSSTTQYVLPAQTKYAAFYFPWHNAAPECSENPGEQNAWCRCIFTQKPGGPRPEAGYYGSDATGNNPAVVAGHMRQLKDGGVGVVAIEWNGEPDIENNIVNPLLPAIAAENMQFVLLYDIAIRFRHLETIDFGNADVRADFVDDFGRFATTFVENPRYLRLNNQPVVYVYVTRSIAGSSADIYSAFQAARDRVRDDTENRIMDIYLVADHLQWAEHQQDEFYTRLAAMRPSAVSAFGPVTHRPIRNAFDQNSSPVDPMNQPVKDWANRMSRHLYQKAKLDLPRLGLEMVDIHPGIFPQFDNTGFGPQEVCWTPPEFPPPPGEEQPSMRYHLQDGTDWPHMINTVGEREKAIAKRVTVSEDCTIQSETNTDTSLVWIYSFNEWGEGTGIEPLDQQGGPVSYPYRFGNDLLNAVETTIGATSTSPPQAAPVQRQPIGDQATLRPQFFWDGVAAATQYKVEITNLVTNTTQTLTLNGAGSTSYSPPGDLAFDEQYRWRVRAGNQYGQGPWSGYAFFTPLGAVQPSAPVMLSPGAGGNECVPGTRPILTWQRSVGATRYKVNITGYSPEQIVWYNDGGVRDGDLVTFQAPIDLVPGRLHHWRVKAINGPRETWAASAFFFTPACESTRSLSINDVSFIEPDAGQANANFTITISPPLTQNGSVSVATANGSAIDGQDYIGTTGLTVSLPANAASVTVPIAVLGDTLYEANETFTVHLSNPSTGLTLFDSQGGGTIVNDDPMPSVSINDTSIIEPDTGQANATFTITISPPLTQNGSVSVATANGSAIDGQDYIGTTDLTVSLPANAASVTVPIAVLGDTLYEANETFTVHLSNPSTGLTILDSQGGGTIVNDEPMPTIAAGAVAVVEGHTGTVVASIPVSLSAPSGLPVSVNFTTAEGSAKNPEDYVALTGTAVIPVGATKASVDISVKGDTSPEADEVFHVDLSAPINATLTTARGTATITTDESPWTIVATGAFNDDNRVDILWSYEPTAAHTAWLMNGVGLLTPEGSRHGIPFGEPESQRGLKIVGTGQFNIVETQGGIPADIKTDVVSSNPATGATSIWLMDGTEVVGNIPTAPIGPSDPEWKAVTTGDFNRDGHQDLVWRHSTSGEVAVWFMSAEVMSHATILEGDPDGERPLADPSWEGPTAGDVNGDGWVDLVFRNGVTNRLVVWTMGPNGGGQEGVRRLNQRAVIRSDGREMLGGPSWHVGGTGDFDLDGKIDVLWRNQATGESFVWYLGGEATAPDGTTGVLYMAEQMLNPAVIWQ